ncbi:MAG: CPBP family intramembrane metalloprotease [Chlorobiaceae bacterium]|nr:CPBP family intramembrane metalloprotease [Chlorobiaceae bacterium]
MQNVQLSDSFAGKRPSFIVNTIVLIGIMALYLVAGAMILIVTGIGSSGEQVSGLTPELVSRHLASIRLAQVFGQIIVLAIPVILLSAFHTGSGNPFSRKSLAFLGVGRIPDGKVLLLGVSGIFLLQPLLHTISSLEQLFLWPALGKAGTEVLRQQEQMDAFIRELAQVHSVPEFFLVIFVLALTPAICEELLFRGYVQQNYTRSMSSGNAVLLTGVVFAFFHMSAFNILSLALLGWFIGYIYAKTGNLAVPAFVHFVNNLAALLVLFFTEGTGPDSVSNPEKVIYSVWWWLFLAGSLYLFMTVVRRLSSENVTKGFV